jgi:hypothetical protein
MSSMRARCSGTGSLVSLSGLRRDALEARAVITIGHELTFFATRIHKLLQVDHHFAGDEAVPEHAEAGRHTRVTARLGQSVEDLFQRSFRPLCHQPTGNNVSGHESARSHSRNARCISHPQQSNVPRPHLWNGHHRQVETICHRLCALAVGIGWRSRRRARGALGNDRGGRFIRFRAVMRGHRKPIHDRAAIGLTGI